MRFTWRTPARLLAAVLLMHACGPAVVRGAELPKPALNAKSGLWEVTLDSEHQAKPTRVEILLPEKFDPAKEHKVLYVLPVGGEDRDPPTYGHGLAEAKRAGVADKFGLICVAPSFAIIPWFGNHATDPKVRQEDYLLKTLIPYVDQTYRTQRSAEGRWLVGFSKSGWGAFTLILRHPDVFGYAAAWDAPFMMNGDNTGKEWGRMGVAAVFGTKENLQKFLPTTLAEEAGPAFKERRRLVLGVGKSWKPHCVQMHELLEKQGIPHAYNADIQFPHRWDSGWFAPLLDEVVRVAGEGQKPAAGEQRPGK